MHSKAFLPSSLAVVFLSIQMRWNAKQLFEIKASWAQSAAKVMLDCKMGLCLQPPPTKKSPMWVISAHLKTKMNPWDKHLMFFWGTECLIPTDSAPWDTAWQFIADLRVFWTGAPEILFTQFHIWQTFNLECTKTNSELIHPQSKRAGVQTHFRGLFCQAILIMGWTAKSHCKPVG